MTAEAQVSAPGGIGGRPQLHSTILARAYYTAPEIFEAERRKIFARQWIFCGHVSEIAAPGDYFVQDLCGESIVILRETGGRVLGFLNVCRHRGHRLVEGPRGSLKQFLCPYHQWSYRLDGGLRQVPGMPDGAVFDYADWPLHRVQVEVFHGLIFARLAADEAPALAPEFAAVEADMAMLEAERIREIQREAYHVRANWKTLLENYLECYHCNGSHAELCATMDLQAMYVGTGGWKSEFFTGTLPLKPGMKTVSADGAPVSVPLGAFARQANLPVGFSTGFGIVPLLTRVIFHIDHAVVHTLRPIDVGNVRWETRWYVREDAVAGRDFDPARVTAVWQATNTQDISLCENAYRGVLSQRFTPGPLDPLRESAIPAALAVYLDLMGKD